MRSLSSRATFFGGDPKLRVGLGLREHPAGLAHWATTLVGLGGAR